MNIREFDLLDQPGIIELQEEFMVEFFPEYANDQRRYQWNKDVYDINKHYSKSGGKIWVVEADNKIVGFGGFRLAESKIAEIKRIRINRNYRGKGIGKAIVKQIECYCAANKFSKVIVDTDDRLEVAKSMYPNLGYDLCRTETETEGGNEYTTHYYEKRLSD